MSAPLKMSFDVACSAEHAFTVWTAGIGAWWPPDHTVTGQADLVVVLQSGVGGRIYERTADGVEHDWGEVTVWKPPNRGWERLGSSADAWRDRNRAGWETLLPHVLAAIAKGDS
jgi:hypothetical protein